MALILTPEENAKFYKEYKEQGNFKKHYIRDYSPDTNKYYLENKEKINLAQKKYREANKDKINLAQKKYREENKERYKEYDVKNRLQKELKKINEKHNINS
jgi:hypothetical protein